MTTNSLVSIAEFQRLTGVSDRSLIEILDRNLVGLQINPEKGLLIDIGSCNLKTLIQSVVPSQLQDIVTSRQLLVENVAEIIDQHLDDLLNEALAGTAK